MRVERWQVPWPPIRVSEDEWVVIRDSIYHPAAIIRRVEFAPNVARFRVVTWAERSADRSLIGYCLTLEVADMLVKFTPGAVDASHIHPPWTHGLTSGDWSRREAARPTPLT
jgi:hypothetical protein